MRAEGQADTGTLALEHPGTTVAAGLDYTSVGDVLELPGSFVSGVVFGATSLTITTSAGTTTFSNFQYDAGSFQPSGYIANFDTATGLEAITFTQGLTTDFEQNTQTSYEESSEYNWSDANNWTIGFPANGAISRRSSG